MIEEMQLEKEIYFQALFFFLMAERLKQWMTNWNSFWDRIPVYRVDIDRRSSDTKEEESLWILDHYYPMDEWNNLIVYETSPWGVIIIRKLGNVTWWKYEYLNDPLINERIR